MTRLPAFETRGAATLREHGSTQLGHSSLFHFLHRDLGLSKGAEYHRKVAAELVQRFPEVIEPLRDGTLHHQRGTARDPPGFALSHLMSKDFPRGLLKLFAASVLFLVVSTALGIWCAVNRLLDFRLTGDVAQQRERGAPAVALEPMRAKSHRLGDRTWWLLWWQVGTFFAGVVLLALSVVFMLCG